MRFLLGIDESGTGAWAGPFCVAGVLLPKGLALDGVTDSKKLNDKRRRELCELIDAKSYHWHVEFVYPADIEKRGQGKCWQTAIRQVIREHLAVLPDLGIVPGQVDIMIDGAANHELSKSIQDRVFGGLRVYFEKKADEKYPAVSAASILAKTHRNDEMNQLHESYPEYGFDTNTGYGTEKHADALVCHGRIPLIHRPLVRKNFHTFERKE